MDPGSLILIAVTLGLLFLITSRGRRQQREAQLMQARLEPGVEVVTTSGLFATVVELDDTVAVLETGPGQRVRWDRRAIGRVVLPDAEAAHVGTDGEGTDAGTTPPHDPDAVPTAAEPAPPRPQAPAAGGSTAADLRD